MQKKSPREYCLSSCGLAVETEQLLEVIHGVTIKLQTRTFLANLNASTMLINKKKY